MLGHVLRSADSSTSTIVVGSHRVRFVSRTYALGLSRASVVWSRPRAVEVTAGGRARRFRIVDVTRAICAGLALVTILVAVGTSIYNMRHKQARKEASL